MRRSPTIASPLRPAFCLVAGLICLTAPASSGAEVTRFGDAVYDSAQRAAAWLVTQQSEDGDIGGAATGLAVLALLEQRASGDWLAPPLGHAGIELEQRGAVNRAVRWMVDELPGFGVAAGPVQSYSGGPALMALSLFATSGGANDVGAAVTVRQAVATAVADLQAAQGISGCAAGAWDYFGRADRGDLSTTQFVAAGLVAAKALVEGADDTLLQVPAFVTKNRAEDGGFQYQCDRRSGSSHAMTAAAIWTSRLVGRPPQDRNVQSAMGWLDQRWRADGQDNFWSGSYYYYLWTAAKALELMRRPDDGGFEGVLYADDLGGVRPPGADGFGEEGASWYYDVAWELISTQRDDGGWPVERPSGDRGRDPVADAAFSALVLERSLGGVCIDEDGDRLCPGEDNCRLRFNPSQEDRDEDGVGDLCDNCPDTANLGQRDDDGDLIGDACDELVCVPAGDEVCNGVDDDCDADIDEELGPGEPRAGAGCRSGLPGACAAGAQECIDGVPLCRTAVVPAFEVCEGAGAGVDEDCDGEIDEALLNTCGRCGPDATETCDGLDQDCDGEADERALCGPDQACVRGGCRPRCAVGECFDGLICVSDGNARGCVTPCEAAVCARSQGCRPDTGQCFDLCGADGCADGQVCGRGGCGPCGGDGDCASEQRCEDGSCQRSPCAGDPCAADQMCQDGACRPSCAGVACAFGEICLRGGCMLPPAGCDDSADAVCPVDPCRYAACPFDQHCEARCCEAECVHGAPPPIARFQAPVFDPDDTGRGGGGDAGGDDEGVGSESAGGAGEAAGRSGGAGVEPPTLGQPSDSCACRPAIGAGHPPGPWRLPRPLGPLRALRR